MVCMQVRGYSEFGFVCAVGEKIRHQDVFPDISFGASASVDQDISGPVFREKPCVQRYGSMPGCSDMCAVPLSD